MMKSILVIDDEQTLRKALKDKFTSEDFEVFEAEDGFQGLEIAQKERPDLILLDILMPKMDGFEFIEKFKEYEKNNRKPPEKNIPIILLTNLDEDKGLGQGEARGVYDYLVKSNWDLDNIVKKVKDKLDIN